MISLRASLELLFSTGVTPLYQSWRAAADKCIPRELGISHALAWPLVVINNSAGTLRQTELAALLGIGNSSLVRSIDQLCAAGLVERCQDSADRRANTLRLTPSGKEWCRTLEGKVAGFRAEALAEVTSDDLETCLRVFAQIKRTLTAETDGALSVPDAAGHRTVENMDVVEHAVSKR